MRGPCPATTHAATERIMTMSASERISRSPERMKRFQSVRLELEVTEAHL